MKSTPMISIVIPAYNSERFITEAVDSVLAQTYSHDEVIVVDDGSTDGTLSRLQRYGDRIRVIHKENGGPASARNAGIREARGEWIAFLDGDDAWDPDKLEKQVRRVTDGGVGLVYAFSRGKEKAPAVEGDIFSRLFWSNFIGTSTVMVKKELLDQTGLFNEGMDFFAVEDYDLWLRICRLCRAACVAEPLVIYREHSGGISRATDRSYINEKNVIDAAYARWPDLESRTGISRARRYSKIDEDWGLEYLEAARTDKARSLLLRALRGNLFRAALWGALMKTLIPRRIFLMLRARKRGAAAVTQAEGGQ